MILKLEVSANAGALNKAHIERLTIKSCSACSEVGEGALVLHSWMYSAETWRHSGLINWLKALKWRGGALPPECVSPTKETLIVVSSGDFEAPASTRRVQQAVRPDISNPSLFSLAY